MQMKFCNAEYCDFVVWSKKSWINERIYANSDFINNAIAKTVDFIKLGILPELVGRWYTKQSLQSDEPSSIQSSSAQSSSTLPSSTQSSSTQSLSSQSSSTQSSSTLPSSTQLSSTQLLSSSSSQPESCQHPCGKQMLNDSNEQSMSLQDNTDEATGDSWCYCRKSESIDHMIGCDNAACLIQWFHLSCLHLTLEQVPKGKWLCPEC